jgi:hypothetical protein
LTTENHSVDMAENDAEKVLSLLDDDIGVEFFDSAIDELGANPLLMGSLMAAQFVRDALNGNPCPDRRYTARIMQFIALSEVKPIAEAKRDDVER